MTKLIHITDKTTLGLIKNAIGGGEQADMRATFDTYAEAKTLFDKVQDLATKAAPGFSCFALPEESFGEGMRASVALLGTRFERDDKTKVVAAKGLVLIAIPSLDLFGSSEAGIGWLTKIADKEAAHVAFRQLRDADSAEELEAGMQMVPTNVESIIERHTRADGVDTTAFDLMWTTVRNLIKKDAPQIADLIPAKGETLKALRSKEFADAEYPQEEGANLFVYIGKLLVKVGAIWRDEKTNEPAPIDTSAIEGWLENRATFKLPERTVAPKDYSVLAGVDLSSLA